MSNCDPQTEPVLVSVKEARRLTGLGNTTIWKLIKDQKLKSVAIGRKRLVVMASTKALAEAA